MNPRLTLEPRLGNVLEANRVNAAVWHIVSALFELARVLVRFDHVASFIVNANNGIVAAPKRVVVQFETVPLPLNA